MFSDRTGFLPSIQPVHTEHTSLPPSTARNSATYLGNCSQVISPNTKITYLLTKLSNSSKHEVKYGKVKLSLCLTKHLAMKA